MGGVEWGWGLVCGVERGRVRGEWGELDRGGKEGGGATQGGDCIDY